MHRSSLLARATLLTIAALATGAPLEELQTHDEMVARTTTTCSEPNETYDARLGACCTVCAAGFGVALPCTETNDTVCSPCTAGRDFSMSASHEAPCETCSSCGKNSRVVHACNATHNTRCDCIRGYYRNTDRQLCMQCTRCGAGAVVERECLPHSDTRCKPCAAGSFARAGAAACTPCRTCKLGERAACTPSQDTVCEELNSYHSTNTSIVATPNTDAQLDIIPIYCSILALIILALVTYVIVKRFRLYPCAPKGHQAAGYKPAAAGEPSMTAQTALTIGSAEHSASLNRKLPAPTSGGSTRKSTELKPILITNETLVRDLPGSLRREIETRLAASADEHKNWVSLAKHLGYNSAKIRAFETHASPAKPGSMSSSRASAAKLMLNDWCAASGGQKANATAGTLITALRAIRRDDVAQLLADATNCKSTWTPIDVV